MHAYIDQTADFVRKQLAQAEAGHDWWHILRVWNQVKLLLEHETGDRLVCELAALLHDIADSKFHDGDETIGPRIAGEFLNSIGVPLQTVAHVQQIISNLSYKANLGTVVFHSKELEIVQDADRLDAMGAIGIARAFHYGGFKNRELYNPGIPPQPDQDKAAYKNSTAPTLNHFYEKLLLLKDKMNTAAAKRIAEERHQFMEQYLKQFYKEWGDVAP
ncbi:HD domain-containing protein [Parapedobacter sp. 10938]|uniref:HD domain-containing protein n=1 Tax=Parapedobacter flavus TaxID=3110225 RepID=UPI002DB7BA67|nr:HD domain-containing protein [Parapedobacter sp. 10938]MEC3879473.1 HD domain-containing protein [Parapedobacter sp. 10938]